MQNMQIILTVSITKLTIDLSIIATFFEFDDKITTSKRHYTSEAVFFFKNLHF